MSAQATLDPTPRSGVAAAPTGGLLLVGEDAPGSLLSAVLPGLRQSIPTTVLNPRSEATKHINRGGIGGVVRRRLGGRGAFDRVLGAAEQLEPDVILLIKGRGVTAEQIRMLRRAGHRVACWYPDNVRWLGGDPGVPRCACADRSAAGGRVTSSLVRRGKSAYRGA